jgi:hypothetical protein
MKPPWNAVREAIEAHGYHFARAFAVEVPTTIRLKSSDAALRWRRL